MAGRDVRGLRLIVTLVTGACLIGAGVWLVWFIDETEFMFLGQSLKSQTIGAFAIYSGAVVMALNIRKKYVDKPHAV